MKEAQATLEDILVPFTFLNSKTGNSLFSLVKDVASLYFTQRMDTHQCDGKIQPK